MNDEIKEILDNMFHIIIKYEEDFEDLEENEIRYQLPYNKMQKFYDYITNLQQDNEMYAQLKDEYEEEIKDLQQIEQEHKKLNAELRQENSNLKTSLDEAQEVLSEYKEENQNLLEEIHMTTIGSYEQGKQDYKEFNEDYKSRCEKASAELKNWEKLDLDNLLVAIRRTQNILQNGSDSQ